MREARVEGRRICPLSHPAVGDRAAAAVPGTAPLARYAGVKPVEAAVPPATGRACCPRSELNSIAVFSAGYTAETSQNFI